MTRDVPSRWPREGSALDLLDKRLSMPVFTLRLNRTLEALLAFPGCLFGMPAFGAPGALVLALVTSGGGTHAARFATAFLLLAVFGVWAAVLFTQTGVHRAHSLYSPTTVLCTPWLALGLLRADALGLAGGGTGCLYLLTWFACIAPILVIKALTSRRRPLACAAEHIGQACVDALARKEPCVIVRMLRRDANASFPSGDVAGAVCFAYGLWGYGATAVASVACVLLAALGRMYWQARLAGRVCTRASFVMHARTPCGPWCRVGRWVVVLRAAVQTCRHTICSTCSSAALSRSSRAELSTAPLAGPMVSAGSTWPRRRPLCWCWPSGCARSGSLCCRMPGTSCLRGLLESRVDAAPCSPVRLAHALANS
jgi:hypothetical protein